MVMLSVSAFTLSRPKVDKRLLPSGAAQAAINCYTDTGKLQSLLKPTRDGFSHYNPPVSIFRERENGGWRDWNTTVDVIRSPIDTTPATLIYTGDGRPKITAVGESISYDLGLPAPTSAPTVEALTAANTGAINNITQNSVASWTGSGIPEAEIDSSGYDREALFPLSQPVSVTADGVKSLNFLMEAFFRPNIDPQGDNFVDVSMYIRMYRDSEFVQEVQISPAIFYLVRYAYPATGTVEMIDLPAAGTYDYTFQLRVVASNNGFLGEGNINYVTVRENNRMRIYSATDHGLAEDYRVQLAGISGTDEMPTKMNGKIFTVAEVISDTVFDIAALVEGEYVSGGTWTQYWSQADIESRAYRYTYVATINGVDYEGPASEASELVDAGQGQEVVISGFEAFPGTWDSPATKIRIYRFAATSSVTGQYQFVGEIAISDTEFSDVVLGENLGESVPDPDREPPVETLQGLIELPSGGAAGFSGKTVYFAIPNQLHAWPTEYGQNTHDDIIAIGAFGSSVAVGTKSQPWVMTGIDPASMSMDKVDLSQPCLSKAGCVNFGYAWTYPCPDGLVLITTGRADVVTLELFTEYQWRAYNPASFKAARYDNLYVCFYEKTNGERGGFMFDPLDIGKGVAFLDFWADAIWTDPSDGSLYFNRNNVISKFDSDVIELDKTWRSKEFATPEVTLTTARVEATKYPVSLSVFCDGQEVVSAQVLSRQAFRIGAPRGSLWSFEVRGQHQIESVFIAENMEELGSYPGGA